RSWSLFRELLRYVDASTCRHDFILRYFGDEAESLGGCGRCDVCRNIDRALEDDPAILAAESTTIRQTLAGIAPAGQGRHAGHRRHAARKIVGARGSLRVRWALDVRAFEQAEPRRRHAPDARAHRRGLRRSHTGGISDPASDAARREGDALAGAVAH